MCGEEPRATSGRELWVRQELLRRVGSVAEWVETSGTTMTRITRGDHRAAWASRSPARHHRPAAWTAITRIGEAISRIAPRGEGGSLRGMELSRTAVGHAGWDDLATRAPRLFGAGARSRRCRGAIREIASQIRVIAVHGFDRRIQRSAACLGCHRPRNRPPTKPIGGGTIRAIRPIVVQAVTITPAPEPASSHVDPPDCPLRRSAG